MGIPTTDLGDILKFVEIISIVGTGLLVVFKLGRATERFELVGQQQAEEIKELKDAVKEILKVQSVMMSEKIRLDTQGMLLAELRQDFNLLRRGEGFIQRDVDGPYPRPPKRD